MVEKICPRGHKYEGAALQCSECKKVTDKAWRTRNPRPAELNIYGAMKSRCQNPNYVNYSDYGGKGVTVCNRWQKFANFIADMGPRPSAKHTLERLDNKKGYGPDNCKWATRAEQARNTSRSRMLTWNGKTQCVKDWATELGIHHQTLVSRIDRLKWPLERALRK